MRSLNQRLYHLTSLAFATLLCALCLGLSTPAVNAQAPTNGAGEFKKRLREQLTNSHRSPRAEGAAAAAEPPTATAIEQQEENSQERSELHKKALAGSWLCDNTNLAGDTLKTLQAFTEDGRAFITGQGDIIPPVISPQFGSWEHLGGRTFAVTVLSIVYDPQGGPAGTFLGTAKIRETITLGRSGDRFKGRFKFVQVDTAGNVVYTNEGAFQGTRIKVEPLN